MSLDRNLRYFNQISRYFQLGQWYQASPLYLETEILRDFFFFLRLNTETFSVMVWIKGYYKLKCMGSEVENLHLSPDFIINCDILGKSSNPGRLR